jgi:hypothetical protein
MAYAGQKKLVAVDALELLARGYRLLSEGKQDGSDAANQPAMGRNDADNQPAMGRSDADNDGAEACVCVIDNGHDYYALEIKGQSRRYFICPGDEIAAIKGSAAVVSGDRSKSSDGFITLDRGAYIAALARVVSEKISRNQFETRLSPFYMKKSQAGKEFFDRFSDMPDVVL